MIVMLIVIVIDTSLNANPSTFSKPSLNRLEHKQKKMWSMELGDMGCCADGSCCGWPQKGLGWTYTNCCMGRHGGRSSKDGLEHSG